jgi:ABC-type multidrug transport system ATPase subunit
LEPWFVAFAVAADWSQNWLSGVTKGVAYTGVNIEDLRRLPLPIPPIPERREIVRRVEALFTRADGIEDHVRVATAPAEHLPQAILARAFRGELVPTEAELAVEEGRDYEPASVLLERIQESRKQNKPAKSGRGGNNMAKRSSRQPAKARRSLEEVLREQGKPLTPEGLFDLAGFDEEFYRDLLDGKDQPLRPLFYARPIHSQFVLLAFFLKQEEETKKFLRDHLCIEELDSVLFVMNQPSWKSPEGDERFWNARGTVAHFLDRLYGLALAPLRVKQRISAGFRKATLREHVYLYLKDVDALRGLAEHYGTQQEFFKALESTYISNLIREVRIRVKARNVDGALTFRELSEGEQQLLMVLGLMRFTKEDESLFLLDEPDTHLNPAWSLRYLEFLREIAGTQENSHIIMATHDPLVIAGLTRSQVQIMQRENGRITAHCPSDDPKGMGVAGLLTSEVYGLRSELDLETMKLLDEKRALAAKATLTEEDRVRLGELDKQLRGLDFTNTVRDPMYKRFAEAMAKRERAEGFKQ